MKQLLLKPRVGVHQVIQISKDLFSVSIEDASSVKEFPSYYDRNFHIKGKLSGEEREFMLKVFGSKHSYKPDYLQSQVEAMQHFRQREAEIQIPFPIRAHNGSFLAKCQLQIENPIKTLSPLFSDCHISDEDVLRSKVSEDPHIITTALDDKSTSYFMMHFVAMLTFVPGTSIDNLTNVTDDVFMECGVLAAKVLNVFKDFHHPVIEANQTPWDIKHIYDIKTEYLPHIEDEEKYAMIDAVIEEYRNLPDISNLPTQIIHHDISHSNVVISQMANGPLAYIRQRIKAYQYGREYSDERDCSCNSDKAEKQAHETQLAVIGLLDFGEICRTFRVSELAVCIAYNSLCQPKHPDRVAFLIYQGFKEVITLSQLEEQVLFTFIKGRLAQSLAIGNFMGKNNPENSYSLNTSKDGWDVLSYFSSMTNKDFLTLLRS